MTHRRLLWFSPHLLFPYLKESDHIGLRVNRSTWLPENEKLAWHIAMMRVVPGVVCMTDHTGFSRNYGDGLNMSLVVKNAPDIHKTSWDLERGRLLNEDFAGMINSRADGAYTQAERQGAEYIYISYGGGVDSCTLLAAMLQHPKSHRWIKENRLIIYTTRYAQREDPLVWNRIVEMGLPLRYLNYDDLMADPGNWMLVTGDVEPVWGSAYTPIAKGYVPDDKLFSGPWQILEKYFMTKDPSGLAWSYFHDIQATAPFEIKTCFQAWWWFEWCTNTQCYMFRLAAYSNSPTVSPDIVYPGKKQFWVLANTDMWDHGAYVTANRLIPEDMSLLKMHSLKYTADWMGWSEPRPKPKIYSQFIIPKRVHKTHIWNDFSWENKEVLI